MSEDNNQILTENQKAFLKLVVGKAPSNKFTQKIAELTEKAKQNTQWRVQYMNWERQRTYDMDAGAQKKANEAATNLIKENIPVETIARCIGLPLEKVLELKKEIETGNI